MKLTFLGTRGNIEARNSLHSMHSSLLVSWRERRIMIDCGEDWLEEFRKVGPDAIVLTHGHPDHAWGLQNGAPCPVYASEETWDLIADYPLEDRHTVAPREAFKIGGVSFEAFPVDHSLRAPAAGYRIAAGRIVIFYVPDVVAIRERSDALAGVSLFIGDGATITRSMVRRKGDALFGHTPVRTQLGWCEKEGVPQALFTHCGSEILDAKPEAVQQEVQALGRERGVEAGIAHDGLELELR